MKPVIIIAIAFVLLIPTTVFAQYMGNTGVEEEKIHYNDVHDSMSKHLEAHRNFMEEMRPGALSICESRGLEPWRVMTPDGDGTHMSRTLNGTELWWDRECVEWDEHPLIQCTETCEILYEGQCSPLGGLDAQRCRIESAQANPASGSGTDVNPEPKLELTCGTGTIEKNGQCVVESNNETMESSSRTNFFDSLIEMFTSWFR
jgi:hypothetical protein